jgi:hypothetical protein
MSSNPENKIVRILQLGSYFSYLPLYYAESQNFFDLLPDGISIKIETPSNPLHRNDAGICKELSRTPLSESIWFAIADPCAISRGHDVLSGNLVVLTPIVTNSSFWVVAKDGRRIERLSDLRRFRKIFSYSHGTTSYGFATKLCLKFQNVTPELARDRISIVEPLHEFSDANLLDLPPDNIILSPDILSICRIKTLDLRNQLSTWMIGNSPEFKDILVTALITRDDVLNTVLGKEVSNALVQAIQRSLLRISDVSYQEAVVETTISYFKEHLGNYSEPIQLSIFRSALEEARKARIFPIFTGVSIGTWVSTYLMSCEIENSREGYGISDGTFLTWEGEAYHTHSRIDPQRFSVGAMETEFFIPIREYARLTAKHENLTAQYENLTAQYDLIKSDDLDWFHLLLIPMKNFLEWLPRWAAFTLLISTGVAFGSVTAFLNFSRNLGGTSVPNPSNDLAITFDIQWEDGKQIDKRNLELKINNAPSTNLTGTAERGTVTFNNVPREGGAKIILMCSNSPSSTDSTLTWKRTDAKLFKYERSVKFTILEKDCK